MGVQCGHNRWISEHFGFHGPARRAPRGGEDDQHEAIGLGGDPLGAVERGFPVDRLLGDGARMEQQHPQQGQQQTPRHDHLGHPSQESAGG
jgi:hypothetical protein